MLKFNLCNGKVTDKKYVKVNAVDLPPEVDKFVTGLYKLFKNHTIDQVYYALGLSKSITNNCLPLETKWVYHYFKQYKTLAYNPAHSVDSAVLLKKLDTLESTEYVSMF